MDSFIPVARIADMLLNPGEPFQYNGGSYTYPDIRLVYWAGGNPFHHHQDLNKLVQAWHRPETIIVNETVWNPLSRHADIVLPATMSLERDDFGGGDLDVFLSPMPQAVQAYDEARDDYDIFCSLADKLGVHAEFSAGRTSRQWVQHLYDQTRQRASQEEIELPEFEQFWQGQQIKTTQHPAPIEFDLEKFRRDPQAHPLNTPSGKIEIFSSTIDAFNYEDCQGHPKWFDKSEWLGCELAEKFPLHLISNQPSTRLHSQLDLARPALRAK